MIDFHNHILPNVDDGPNSIEESIEMLRCAEQQGITDVVNTVHFQHPKMDNKNVEYNYLKNQVNKLQNILNKERININIHLSAEVFYLPNLVNISKNPLVTIGNGSYMLIEFPLNIFPQGYENEFFNLQNVGITPIVAHPERYRFVKGDQQVLTDWINRGYILQLDAGSILGHFGKKNQTFSINMLRNNLVHIIGSDAHNNKKRNFVLQESYEMIENLFGIKYVEFLKANIYNLLFSEKNELDVFSFDNKKKYNNFNFFKNLFKF